MRPFGILRPPYAPVNRNGVIGLPWSQFTLQDDLGGIGGARKFTAD
jgi:hypothetical protein